jgi:carbonic anhydrase/acetyltransferase-like protein (isoleucine patch superfamily)
MTIKPRKVVLFGIGEMGRFASVRDHRQQRVHRNGGPVGHDTTIGDHSFLVGMIAIAGLVKIGSYCFIGIHSTVRDRLTIADRTVIGAGAIVLRDTQEGAFTSHRRRDFSHTTARTWPTTFVRRPGCRRAPGPKPDWAGSPEASGERPLPSWFSGAPARRRRRVGP